ncbi:ABC transporter ATP-binding protein [Georgenia yuyongxinii]|uniref:ABC transporter ATP-binding protein n=1 Tax=Georgenia yuyongxinii TaxID=2589797 RepID=A0A552WPM6_9MICO|nr:ABC transporter ATP-binding protein [Georgenia yuyongxinii]TRW44667.1 ABC transporter ATP-binding protein [Georgenia yuyongxinii]
MRATGHPESEPCRDAGERTAPVLEVRDLHVHLRTGEGEVHAVRGIDLAVRRGEVLAVVGASGSGKSATALAVMGLLPASARVSGSVRLDGAQLLDRSDAELSRVRGARIGMVFQDAALTPVYPVGEQIAEAVRAHRRLSRAAARARAVELLELVGIDRPAARAQAFPHELSGGMRQRVAIAIAVANDPDVLVADEPTSALDVTVQAQVLEVLRTARDETGAALVLISHDLGVVAGLADRVAVLDAGRVVEENDVETIFARPGTPVTRALLDAVARPALRASRVPDASPVAAAPLAVPAAPPDRAEVLRVTDLHRHFPLTRGALLRRRVGTVRAVDGVSLTVRAGEVLALVGESGSGKTTTVRSVLELTTPERGSVVVLGTDVDGLDRAGRRRLRRGVQVVLQDPDAALDPRLPVIDLVAEPLLADGRTGEGTRRRVAELLGLVGLDPALGDRFPRHLSGGQRQRVAIARALALQPRLLVLDEPVSALDAPVQAEILELLGDLRDRLSLSYLLVTHDLTAVRRLADGVAVMHLGRVVESGDAARVLTRPAHPYTRALLSAVPVADPVLERRRERTVLVGDVPSPVDPPPGCRFRTRCPLYRTLDDAAQERCRGEDQPLRTVGGQRAGGHHPPRREPGTHEAACHVVTDETTPAAPWRG